MDDAGAVLMDHAARVATDQDFLGPNLAVGGYGHGVANVWTEDRHRLAVASQTASMLALGVDPLTAFSEHTSELRRRGR